MSNMHLGKGTSCPAVVPGKLRLYSMRFCPFCQRARLVLLAKCIPHDIVNVNLQQKPDWLFQIHADGKVPVLDTGKQIVIESLVIANFLNDEYTNTPLYPSDKEQKAKDVELIEKYGKVVGAISSSIYAKEDKPTAEYYSDILAPLQDFEDELAKRGTTYFGGSVPGMVDYMMWPWIERLDVLAAMRNEEVRFPKCTIPKLAEWENAMKADPAVLETFIDVDKHVKFLRGYFTPSVDAEFDNI